MKSPILKTLAVVMIGVLMFFCGWFLRNDGWERIKEDWTGKYRARPYPGFGPLALGPEGYYWGVNTDSDEMPGYLYKMKADGSGWKIVHTFRPEGSRPVGIDPQGAVVFDGVDSMLGITARGGGSGGNGTLYKVNVKTGDLTTLLEFTGGEGPHLGRVPRAPLVPDGLGYFWGSTMRGGTKETGTIFKYHLATGVLTTVVEMPDAPDAQTPSAILEYALTSDGKGGWWGSTMHGGKADCGTIFKVKGDTGELTTVVEFPEYHGGRKPTGSLVSDGQGFIWGMCSQGGQEYGGTVFKVDATPGALTTVVEFTREPGSNLGACPQATLVDDGQGFLWGSTTEGGSGDGGTLFKIDITSGVLTTVVEFHRDESRHKGYEPVGALTSYGQGAFLGTTMHGGKRDAGTVFKVDVKTGVLTTLVEFGKVGP